MSHTSNVDGHFAEVPSRPIKRDGEVTLDWQQMQDQVDHQIIGQIKRTEETLNPAIVGLLLGFAVEDVGQFAEVNGCEFDEGNALMNFTQALCQGKCHCITSCNWLTWGDMDLCLSYEWLDFGQPKPNSFHLKVQVFSVVYFGS